MKTFGATSIPSREYDNIVGNADSYMALWPSGKAKVCNTSIPGSIPGGASKKLSNPTGLLNFLSNPKDWYVINVHCTLDVICAPRSMASRASVYSPLVFGLITYTALP